MPPVGYSSVPDKCEPVSAKTSANWPIAQSISSAVMTSGGAKRSVEPCVSLTRTPRSASLQADLLAGAERGVDVDARPQTHAAHGDHAVTDQAAQPRVQVLAEFG